MRPLKPCGTYAAWTRHYRNGEPIDDACAEAHRIYATAAQRRARKRGSASLPPCTACGGPRKLRQGSFGWCNACYLRWRYAGQPEDGPPPRYGGNEARREDYFWLRDVGEPIERAAERAGISVTTARTWDASRCEAMAS